MMSRSLHLPSSLSSSSSSSSRTILASSISSLNLTRHASTTTRRHIDPWAVAAARQKRAANLSRQQELRAQREAALGHPLRGKSTPFMETLVPGRVAALSAELGPKRSAEAKARKEAKEVEGKNQQEIKSDGEGGIEAEIRQEARSEGDGEIPKMKVFSMKYKRPQPDEHASDKVLETQYNYFLNQEEVETSLERSRELIRPVPVERSHSDDPVAFREAKKAHERGDEAAREAIRRIIQLQNGNNKDLTRLNVTRCIQEFGRHNTDAFLAGRLPAHNEQETEEGKENENSGNLQTRMIKTRVGPDTGSPEVQAAILTTKIEVLSRQLEHTSHKDKHNKRNLRVLVHRRQKLLKYLRRKERGGPRWQNLMEKLGLTDASWKGEISM